MSLSLIIPAFNEEEQIKITIKKLINFKKNISNLEILVIDDKSTDKTYKIVKYIKKK